MDLECVQKLVDGELNLPHWRKKQNKEKRTINRNNRLLVSVVVLTNTHLFYGCYMCQPILVLVDGLPKFPVRLEKAAFFFTS